MNVFDCTVTSTSHRRVESNKRGREQGDNVALVSKVDTDK